MFKFPKHPFRQEGVPLTPLVGLRRLEPSAVQALARVMFGWRDWLAVWWLYQAAMVGRGFAFRRRFGRVLDRRFREMEYQNMVNDRVLAMLKQHRDDDVRWYLTRLRPADLESNCRWWDSFAPPVPWFAWCRSECLKTRLTWFRRTSKRQPKLSPEDALLFEAIHGYMP